MYMNKRVRATVILLMAIAVMSLFGTTAFADLTGATTQTDAHVASIQKNGTTYYYESLQTAINEADSEGTVTVLKDITLDLAVTIDKNLTLKGAASDSGVPTVTGSAKTKSINVGTSADGIQINLKVENLKIDTNGGSASKNYLYLGNAELEIGTGAEVTGIGWYSSGSGFTAKQIGSPSVIINGGSVTYINQVASVTMNSGSQSTGYIRANSITVNGGTVADIYGSSTSVTVNGGTVTKIRNNCKEITISTGGTIETIGIDSNNKVTKLTLKGGTLGKLYGSSGYDLANSLGSKVIDTTNRYVMKNYLPDGTMFDDDGVIVVDERPTVATIQFSDNTTKNYKVISEAIADIKNGCTLTIKAGVKATTDKRNMQLGDTFTVICEDGASWTGSASGNYSSNETIIYDAYISEKTVDGNTTTYTLVLDSDKVICENKETGKQYLDLKTAITDASGKELTLLKSVTLNSSGWTNGIRAVLDTGELEFTGITMNDSYSNNRQIVIKGNGTFSGDVLMGQASADAKTIKLTTYGGTYNGAVNDRYGLLTVPADSTAVFNGNITVTGMSNHNGTSPSSKNGELEIAGGTFNGDIIPRYGTAQGSNYIPLLPGRITITGGKFNGTIDLSNIDKNKIYEFWNSSGSAKTSADTTNLDYIKITGGQFKQKFDSCWLPLGKRWSETADSEGYWTIVDDSEDTVRIYGLEDIVITAGESRSLSYTLVGDTNATVAWTSSDTAIATVDDTGKVTAVKKGTAIITASAGKESVTCNVTVVATYATGISIDKTGLVNSGVWSKTIPAGTEYQLSASVTPEGADSDLIIWTSENPDIVTVDENGKVTALEAFGESKITASIQGENDKYTDSVYIYNYSPFSSLTLNQTEVELLVGETVDLTATIAPAYVKNQQSFPWEITEGSDVVQQSTSYGTECTFTAVKVGDAKVTYTAKSTENTLTAECVIHVVKPNAVVTKAPEEVAGLIYDGSNQSLVIAGEATGGEMQYVLGEDATTAPTDGWSADIPTATDAGIYYVWYKVEGDANHNSTESDKVEVTIAKATPTVTAPTAKTLTYTGEAQELVTAGSTNGGELQYSLDGTNYSTTVPTGKDAGNYTVYFKVVGDDNYADTPAASFTVTIAGADAGNTKPGAADSLTYTGEAQKLVTGGSVTGGELQYAIGTDASTAPALDSFKTDIPTGTDAGTYYVWYRVKGDANHNDVAPACIEVKIAKAAIKPEVSITGWTYGEKANAPAVTGNTDNGAVTYTYSDKQDGTFTATVPVNAGTWYVKATVAETDNYLGGEATLSFAIAKATLTVTAADQTKVEGEADPQLTYTVTGLVGSDILTGALARQPGEDAGTYDITQGTLAASDNYNISFTKGTLTITAKPVSGHVEVETKTGAGVPPMNVAGMTDEFAKKVLTPTELVMMDNGANAHVYVEATNTDGSISDTMKQQILHTLPSGAKIATTMDVSMYKQVGDNLPVKVSGLPAPVTLEFDVSRYGSRTAGMQHTIFVMHYMNGAWRVEGQGAGPTITVQVNELSPFAIAYVDTPIATPEPTAKPTKAPKPTAEPTAKPTKAPKPTVKPTKEPKPTVKPEPTVKPTTKPTVKPTVKPEPKPVKADYTLLAKMTVCGSSKTSLEVSWTKVKEADGYDVFFAKCGKNYKLKGSIHGTSVRFTKLSKRAGYKAYVRAWKLEGSGKVYIGKASPEVHAITGGYNAKSCNARDVRLNRSSMTLKVGKSKTIKATVKGVKSGRKLLDHVRLVRWYSSNVNVATVNKNGKVKATGSGTCTIYAIANNGVRTSVKVTVK